MIFLTDSKYLWEQKGAHFHTHHSGGGTTGNMWGFNRDYIEGMWTQVGRHWRVRNKCKDIFGSGEFSPVMHKIHCVFIFTHLRNHS